jgi:lysophospholipase L1-like esterase
MVSNTKIIRKAFVQNLGIMFCSIFFIIIVAEGVLRIFFTDYLMSPKRFPQGFFCMRDPLLGWIGKSNIGGIWRFYDDEMDDMHILMNSDGFWDDAHPIRKMAGFKRILFLGDSFTIGYGVNKNDRFTELIKKQLSTHFQVINMGMWGYSTDQELLVLKEKGLKYSPDVVILCLFLDDLFTCNLFSVNNGRYLKPKFKLDATNRLKLTNVPIPNNRGPSEFSNLILTRYFEFRNRIESGDDFWRKQWISVFDRGFLREYKMTLSLVALKEINDMSLKNNADFLLVVIPYKKQINRGRSTFSYAEDWGIPAERLDLDLPQKVVISFCRRNGIPVLDLLPVFKSHNDPKRLFFRSDLHWTKEGHRIAAKEILSFLRQKKYL